MCSLKGRRLCESGVERECDGLEIGQDAEQAARHAG